MSISLGSTEQIPPSITRVLQRFDDVFTTTNNIEEVLCNADLRNIAAKLDQICVAEGVIGYHFTRAIREEIEADGLLVSNGPERRAIFMSRYGRLFSKTQRQRIRAAWDSYFDELQDSARNGRVYFNLTRVALCDGGASPLLMHFGGEAVYMSLTRDPDITAILRGIGDPLVVACALQTEGLETYSEQPWGRTWLSAYHVSRNPQAHQHDEDVSSRVSIAPSSILSIQIADLDCIQNE